MRMFLKRSAKFVMATDLLAKAEDFEDLRRPTGRTQTTWFG